MGRLARQQASRADAGRARAGWPCTGAPERRCTRWRRCPSLPGSPKNDPICGPGAALGGHQGLRPAGAPRRARHRPLHRLGHRPAGHPPLEWDPEALHLAAISADQLPELVPTTKVLPGLPAEAAQPCGFRPQRPSSRARATARWPTWAWERSGPAWPPAPSAPAGRCGSRRASRRRPAGGTFCYALTEQRWVVGGAINNGGLVLEWAGDALAPELGDGREDQLLAQAATAPPGSGGLDHAALPAKRARPALEPASAAASTSA